MTPGLGILLCLSWAAGSTTTEESPSEPTSQSFEAEDSQPQSAPASQPAVDPFFDRSFDESFDQVDTTWQSDTEVAQAADAFVGERTPYDQWLELAKRDLFRLTLKLRTLASVQQVPDTRQDGFELQQLRAQLDGDLGRGLGYHLEVDAAAAPALVDAVVRYAPWTFLQLSVGRMRVPFSREFLIDRPYLSFVERSQAVMALAPGRGVGVQVGGGGEQGAVVGYWLGVFNGASTLPLDWGRSLLYAGRLQISPLAATVVNRLIDVDLGLSAAFGWNELLDLRQIRPLAAAGEIQGTRALGSGDLRVRVGPAWIAGELLFTQLRPAVDRASTALQAWGGYAEAGLSVLPERLDVMARYDALSTSLHPELDQLLILGGRVHATEFLWLQLNYAWGPRYGRSIFWSPNQLVASLQLVI